MMSEHVAPYDAIILGQGIAGTTLAWHLFFAGQNVLVIDREEAVTSSRIAAGLVTPITGKRLVKNWKFDEFWPVAVEFYHRVEEIIEQQIFEQADALRVFQSLTELDYFRQKESSYGALVRRIEEVVDSPIQAPLGSFEMRQAGRLRVREYLDASREVFSKLQRYLSAKIDVADDIEVLDDHVLLNRLGIKAKKLVFCQGHVSSVNPYFSKVTYNPAKGEILTVRICGLKEERIVHHNVWLVPLGNEMFRVGSTYEWDQIDQVPTELGREDLLQRLRLLVKQPLEVIEHQAAVRPVMMDSKPLIGVHPQYPQFGFFNGLGSKGALQAPLLASQLCQLMMTGVPVDPEFDLQQKVRF